MPKKAKPRSLSAEPLEERLPISSSAAGVLFGFGLAQNEPGVERSATPGYEASQTIPSSSVTQQSTLIDLTLDLQLDTLAVDLFHAEESLLDTISSASEDPFVLTPLTPSAALSDTETDAHRELGDELLLFQISTLDFTQVSFEPVMPYRESVSHDFGDALTPPEDLTAYGYSPIANELKENGGINGGGGPQMSCCGPGGGSGSGSTTPYVQSACLTGGYTTACSAPRTHVSYSSGSYIYSHSDHTMYMFQNSNNAATINAAMNWVGTGTGTITVYAGGMVVAQGTSGNGVNSFSYTLYWAKPNGVANDAVDRDFTFTFTVSGGNTVALDAHIGYAEVQVQFAGQGGFASKTTAGGQTASNTVVVGQHVEAELHWDHTFTPTTAYLPHWSTPSGGDFVKNYITNDTEGRVVTHNPVIDYDGFSFDYYYTRKTANTGSISCGSIALKDPHGDWHYPNAEASFYIETPTVDSFSSVFASWDPAENAVGVRVFGGGFLDSISVMLGGTPENKDFSPGITWTANVTAPPVIGGGEIAYNNQVCVNECKRIENGEAERKQFVGVGFMLDTHFPYNKGYKVPVNTTLVNEDSPGQPCYLPYDTFIRSDSFQTYLIYKPKGHKDHTIWVTLSVINWGWSGTAICTDPSPWPSEKWELDTSPGAMPSAPNGGGNGTPTSYLPEWGYNIINFSSLYSSSPLANWVKVDP